MTPHSVRRAAERKEKRAARQAALHGAATPAPLPHEPDVAPVLPVPDVAPPDFQSEPETPQPAIVPCEGFFVNGESIREFDEFSERLYDHYMPYNSEEQIFVVRLAECRWSLRRRKRVVERVEAELYAAQPDPAKWCEADFKCLAVADAYRAQAEQAVCRAQKNVDAFTRQRVEDYRFHANRDLAFNHFELQKKKYEFAVWKAGVRPKRAAASGEVEPEPSTKNAVAA